MLKCGDYLELRFSMANWLASMMNALRSFLAMTSEYLVQVEQSGDDKHDRADERGKSRNHTGMPEVHGHAAA